jgi:hypothetical protein
MENVFLDVKTEFGYAPKIENLEKSMVCIIKRTQIGNFKYCHGNEEHNPWLLVSFNTLKSLC